MQSKTLDEHFMAVQDRIDECEKVFKNCATELVVDTETVKTIIKNYVTSYFEQAEIERENIAYAQAFLTESVFLE